MEFSGSRAPGKKQKESSGGARVPRDLSTAGIGSAERGNEKPPVTSRESGGKLAAVVSSGCDKGGSKEQACGNDEGFCL